MKPLFTFLILGIYLFPRFALSQELSEEQIMSNEASQQPDSIPKDESVENKVDELLKRFDKKNPLLFGLSIGYRQAFSIGKADKFLADAIISPFDSTLQIELLNRHTFLISATLSSFPFEKDTTFKNFGFFANINLAEIASDGDFQSVFNRQIEGGAGISWRLGKSLALAFSYEFIFHRRIRDYLFPLEGSQLIVANTPISSLDKDVDEIFRNDNVNAWSLKFIFFFNKSIQ